MPKGRLRLLIVAAAMLVAAAGLTSCGEPAGSLKVVVLTDETFDEMTSEGVVLVDFWATWCPPCRTQGPIVDAIAEEYDGDVVVCKLDVDDNPQTAKVFKVRSIPTLIIFRDGEVAQRFTGLQSEAQLGAALDAALAE